MIGIKDMEMPTTCNECKLRSESLLYHYPVCNITRQPIQVDIKTDKDVFCPLVEVEE